MRPASILALALLLAMLAGCATRSPGLMPDAPPAYRAAYDDGCASGYVAAGHPWYRYQKNLAAYEAGGQYRAGWDDGFRVCQGRYSSLGR